MQDKDNKRIIYCVVLFKYFPQYAIRISESAYDDYLIIICNNYTKVYVLFRFFGNHYILVIKNISIFSRSALKDVEFSLRDI